MEDNFSKYLRSDWQLRRQEDHSFSLRKYARLLGIDATALSRIVKGERRVTIDTFLRIAAKLQMSAQQIEFFQRGLTGQRGRPPAEARAGRVADPSGQTHYELLEEEVSEALSHWYLTAILETAYLDDFVPDPRWIARRLGISELEVKIGLKQLLSLGLIEMRPEGGWTEKFGHFTNINGKFTSAAKRSLQKELLRKALEAVDSVDFDRRDQTSLTFAVDAELLGEARELITRFRRDLNQLMQKTPVRDQVYQLTVSLFPLTTPKHNKGESPL